MDSFTSIARQASNLRGDDSLSRKAPSNISREEQWLSWAAGGGLIAYGLLHRSRWSLPNLLVGAALLYRGWTCHCTLYEQLGIDTSQDGSAHRGVRAQHGRKVNVVVHVNRDRRELYDYWRNFENLPKVMRHLQSVTILDDKRSGWEAVGPLGKTLRWDAEIINDRPGEIIAWESLPGSEVDTAGSVHFRTPAFGDGTEVQVMLKYDPPGGTAVAKFADWLGYGLQQELEEDLRRFKQQFETGETATAAQHPKV